MSDPTNPWTTLSSRLVYENPWIRVREDQVLRPDGQPGIYGVVEFKNRAVGVLPVDDEGCIWLVGQHRYPLNSYSWEIPEGGSPQSETPKETAPRAQGGDRPLSGHVGADQHRPSVQLGLRRDRLHLPGHGTLARPEHSRGDRKAPCEASDVERSVGHAPKGRNHRFHHGGGPVVRGGAKIAGELSGCEVEKPASVRVGDGSAVRLSVLIQRWAQ